MADQHSHDAPGAHVHGGITMKTGDAHEAEAPRCATTNVVVGDWARMGVTNRVLAMKAMARGRTMTGCLRSVTRR